MGWVYPVDDASTEVTFPEKGEYYVYVRTYNWTSPWKKGEGPGKFSLSVGGKKMTSPWERRVRLDVADSRKGVCQESENCNQIA